MGTVVVDSTEDAFRDLVVSASPGLMRAASLLTGDQSLAQDLVQAAFERSWARWERVAAADEPVAYVRQVMISLFLTWRRRRWWGEIPSGEPWQVTAADDEAETLVVRRSVLAALSGLSSRQRAVIVLRYFADLSEAETAATLGCSAGSVKAHASRALSRLRSAPELDGLWRQEVFDEQR